VHPFLCAHGVVELVALESQRFFIVALQRPPIPHSLLFQLDYPYGVTNQRLPPSIYCALRVLSATLSIQFRGDSILALFPSLTQLYVRTYVHYDGWRDE
jgi:hypothetical protein